MSRLNNSLHRALDAADSHYFLSRPSLLFLAPALILTSVLLNSDFANFENVTFWILANVFSVTATWLFIELVLFGIGRQKRKKTKLGSTQILITAGAVGAFKGLTTTYFATELGLLELENLAEQYIYRIAQTTLLGLILIPVTSALLSVIADYSEKREALISEAWRLKLTGSGDLSEFVGNETQKEYEEGLRKIRTSFDKMLREAEQKSTTDIASELTYLVQGTVKPLSNKFWKQKTKHKRFKQFKELFLFAIAENPFNLIWVVGIYAFITGALVIQDRGVLMGTSVTLVCSSIVAVILGVANSFETKKSATAILRFILALFITSAATMYYREFASVIEPAPGVLGYFIAELIFLSSMSAGIAFVAATTVTTRSINYLYERYFQEALETDSTQIASVASRHLANYLHGTVQNLMIQASQTLRDSESISKEELKSVLSELSKSLELANLKAHASYESLEDALEASINLWQGFVKVDFVDFSTAAASNYISANEVFYVLEEAVGNAFKHGLATEVEISLRVAPGGSKAILEFTDNGLGVRKGAAGQGSALYNAVSKGKWSLKSLDEGGTSLCLELDLKR